MEHFALNTQPLSFCIVSNWSYVSVYREALSSRMEITLILISLLKCLGKAVCFTLLQKWKRVPACLQLVLLPWGIRKDRAQPRSFWALCHLLLFWDLQLISWKCRSQWWWHCSFTGTCIAPPESWGQDKLPSWATQYNSVWCDTFRNLCDGRFH